MSIPRPQPSPTRAIAFFDGQNIFNAAKEAFGYSYPNYDVLKLAQNVCDSKGWSLYKTYFYTGMPDPKEDERRHQFWSAKLLSMSRQGVKTFHRPLRYSDKLVKCPDGQQHDVRVAEEKGVDVRIAVDVIQMGYHQEYDVALIFSQDQDFSEVAKEIRKIAGEQSRWIKMASAFPIGFSEKVRGINSTEWIKLDKATYDLCIDPCDYRKK